MNVYKLEAAIGLNTTEYKKGLAAAGESMAAMGQKIKTGAAAIGKVATAAFTATAAAAAASVTALTKSALNSYADYEQLVGGVEKLFGESSDLLMAYAEDAYKTAGLSVNEYMETATSFAAALTSSVQAAGGSMDEAVELADTAMRDMSDNANTFGTDMASIQTAYQGFSKGQYQLLDNLKLGYGGTKAEMERLIEDANKLRHEQGINNDLTIESYADIITAIHEVQTEMKITGTTSREASKTISGSIGAMKAAWTNLVTELGKDNGDISGKFDALVESATTSFDNISPRIQMILENIGTLIEKGAPIILPKIGALAKKVLPGLLLNGTKLTLTVFTTIAEQIPVLAEYILPQLPLLWAKLKNLGSLIFDNVIKPAWAWVTQKLPGYINAELKKIDFKKIGTTMSDLIKEGLEGIADFVDNIDWEQVGNSIGDFLAGIDWKGVLKAAFKAIVSVVKATPDLIGGVIEAIGWEDAAAMAGVLFAPKLLKSIAGELELPGMFDNIKSILGKKTTEGAEDFGGAGVGGTKGFGSMFVTGIQSFLLGWSIGTWIYDKWGPEIDEVLFKLFDKVTAFVDSSKNQIKSALGIKDEPTKEELDQFAKEMGIDKQVAQFMGTDDRNIKAMNISPADIAYNWKTGSTGGVAASLIRQATATANAIAPNIKRPDIESPSAIFRHATGGVMISSPVLTTSGHLFGEAGREAILPLDNNTGWMDELASKIGHTGGIVVQTLNLNMEGMRIASDYDTDRFIERISERLENLKVSDLRGVGGVRY